MLVIEGPSLTGESEGQGGEGLKASESPVTDSGSLTGERGSHELGYSLGHELQINAAISAL